MFITALFIIAKRWTCPSTDRWVNKILSIHTVISIILFFSHKQMKCDTYFSTSEP